MNKVITNNKSDSHEVKSILKKKHIEFLLNQRLKKMVEIGDLVEVEKLIDEGATLHKLVGMQLDLYNFRSSEHDTLLHTAVKLGHVEIVRYLIHCGCEVNVQTRRNKAAPLHYATYPSVPAVILDILLDNGASIEIKDVDNASPFLWGCYLNNTRAIKTLLQRNADVFGEDIFGLSPLEWASHQGHLESVTLLIQSISFSKTQLKAAYNQAVESGQTKTANVLNKQLSK
jgi:ankyrin repeat protein